MGQPQIRVAAEAVFVQTSDGQEEASQAKIWGQSIVGEGLLIALDTPPLSGACGTGPRWGAVFNVQVLNLSFHWFPDSCHQLRLSHLPEECPLWLRGVLAASIQGKEPRDPSEPGQDWVSPEVPAKPVSFLWVAKVGAGAVQRLRLRAWRQGPEDLSTLEAFLC